MEIASACSKFLCEKLTWQGQLIGEAVRKCRKAAILKKEREYVTEEKIQEVVLTPVFQNYQQFQYYMPVSRFYQNVQKEGVPFA